MPDVRGMLDRLVFEPSAPWRPDRLLGLLVLALVALVAWLIVWPFIPPLVAGIFAAVLDLLAFLWSALASLTWSRRAG